MKCVCVCEEGGNSKRFLKWSCAGVGVIKE